MTVTNRYYPLVIKAYLGADIYLDKLFLLCKAGFIGCWMGILNKDMLHTIDKFYYDNTRKYVQDTYNRKGLWKWEKEMLHWHFGGCRTLLVAGVGGGREVFALHQLGYMADGFECNPLLVDYAQRFLRDEDISANIRLAPRDDCPDMPHTYDGLIIGWGAYMLIQGQQQRIAFLQKLRAHARPKAPILLSFFVRPADLLYFKVIATLGNTIRRMRRTDRLELGDALSPNYVHYFTKQEIAQELREGGFELVYYGTDDYGHAVGVAA